MITTTSLWFDHKRNIALTLNGAIFGIAGVTLLVTMIGHFGFSGAMSAAAGAMLVQLLPVILIVISA